MFAQNQRFGVLGLYVMWPAFYPVACWGTKINLRGQWCDAVLRMTLEGRGKSPFFSGSCWWNMRSFTQQNKLEPGNSLWPFWGWLSDLLEKLEKWPPTFGDYPRSLLQEHFEVDFPTSQVIFQDSPKLMAVSHDVLVLLRKILHRHGRCTYSYLWSAKI